MGKLIILSFRDDEEALFLAKQYRPSRLSQTFPRWPPPQTHHCSLVLCKSTPQRRLVREAGQTVDLTPMEFDILLLLARRPGQVFSARQIYEAVAADSFDASWTGISSMVYKLRRKLGAGIIETVRGHGYKFVAPGTSPK